MQATSNEPPRARPAPRVTVIIPCRNEEAFVGETLQTILFGTFPPSEMEVLVVDGRSTDRTRQIVADFATRDRRVWLIDNPVGSTPAALNRGIAAARGEIIVRVDCHSMYPPNYVEALVRALETTDAEMVGGRVENVPASSEPGAAAIAIALGSPFATGSPFRYQKKSGPVDAVQLGCWRRSLFDRVGLFDERLLRNQDNEHSARILARGGRVHLTDEVCVHYHPRSTLRALAKQAMLNGTWNAFTERLCPYAFRWRHLVPGLFVLGLVAAPGAMVLAALAHRPLLFALTALPLVVYLLLNGFASTVATRRAQRPALRPRVALVLAVWHVVYGVGVLWGWLLVATGRFQSRLGRPSTTQIQPTTERQPAQGG